MPDYRVLIDSTDVAVTTDPINLVQYIAALKFPAYPIAIWTWGLGVAEEIEIQFPTDLAAPNNWVTVFELTAVVNQIAVYAPCSLRIVKPATAGQVGVAASAVRGI